MRKGFVIAFLLSSLVCQLHADQTFKSKNIERAAEVLGIIDSLGSVALGHSLIITAKDGQTVRVRKSENNVIEHIGMPLFNNQMLILMPSPVYDFLEFAVLNIKYKVNPNTLYLSKVMFKKGNWNTLMKENLSESDCSISNQDDKLYIVNWKRGNADIAILGIPIEYELLNNDTRRNIERSYVCQLESYFLADSIMVPEPVTEDNLKIYGTEGLFVI